MFYEDVITYRSSNLSSSSQWWCQGKAMGLQPHHVKHLVPPSEAILGSCLGKFDKITHKSCRFSLTVIISSPVFGRFLAPALLNQDS